MTTCCAILTDDGCWLGTDTMAVHGTHVDYRAKKYVTRNGVTILAAGAAIALDVVDRSMTKVFGSRSSMGSRAPITVTALMEAIRNACNQRGWLGSHIDDAQPEKRDLELLITDGNHLFEVDSFFCARRCELDEFVGIGVCAYGYGAAFVSQRLGMPGNEILTQAVEASIRFSVYVGGEPVIWKVDCSTEWSLSL
jgi:hypothetical protein